MKMPLMVILLVGMTLAGCAAPDTNSNLELPCEAPIPTYPDTPRTTDYIATIETNFGDITIDLATQEAPLTVANFVGLAQSGFYEDLTFHRIITNFMMQGGDPLGTGTGGSGNPIDDEFHPDLRHERGVISMAKAGPNTGTSQFFITFDPAAHLDDKHAVFGHVTEGFDVLDRIESDAASTSGTPRTAVTLENVRIEEVEIVPDEAQPTLFFWAEGIRSPEFGTCQVLVMGNPGNTIQTFELTGTDSIEMPGEVTVAAGTTLAVPIRIPGPGSYDVSAGRTSLSFEVLESTGSSAAQDGDAVRAHYIGMLPDGRIFDTSLASVATDATSKDMTVDGVFSQRTRGSPFTFTVGGNVIEGFSQLAKATVEGGSNSLYIPAAQAYGETGQSPLAGRDLIFTLELLE